MYLYSTYGLIIQSPIALPELNATNGKPDVVIRFGRLAQGGPWGNRESGELQVRGADIYLMWDDIGYFLIRGGREIIIEPLSDIQEHVLRLFVLGTTLAMLLCQRGLTVFHASAVSMGGHAVAFAGIKGAGKSTFAAALHAVGYNMIADDILAIDMSSGHPMVLPGFPHLKLWPDSVSLLGQDPDRLPRLRPEVNKRSYPLTQRFTNNPLPLRHFCIISPATTLELESYEPSEALGALMPHWYGARFGMKQLRALSLPMFFRQCVDIARSAKVYRLGRPQSKPVLNSIRSLFEEKLLFDARNDRGDETKRVSKV